MKMSHVYVVVVRRSTRFAAHVFYSLKKSLLVFSMFNKAEKSLQYR
jgi:hypothetical protein